MDWLSLIPWSGFGWGGLILVAFLAVLRGDLVPRQTHEAITKSLTDSLHRERLLTDRAMGALRLVATEYGTTADKVLSALPLEEEGDERAG